MATLKHREHNCLKCKHLRWEESAGGFDIYCTKKSEKGRNISWHYGMPWDKDWIKAEMTARLNRSHCPTWCPMEKLKIEPQEEENIMTETEKIIKGLQCCGQESEYGCDDCPYNVDPDDFTTCRQLYTDAVKQLKQLDALVKALELEKKEAEANE